jgi:hypothetical protein
MLPLAGAVVELGGPAYRTTTVSNAAGYYLLCPGIPGTGTDIMTSVTAHKDGYLSGTQSLMLGWDYSDTNIELVRQ